MKTINRRQVLRTGAIGSASAVVGAMLASALPVSADNGNPPSQNRGDGRGDHDDRDGRKVEANLKAFDILDFEAWNKRNWDLFRKFHTDDVVVFYPNGASTVGIEAHVAASQASLQGVDLIITSHPIRFGSGDYTAVTGTVDVKLPNGAVIKTEIVTIARWKNGRIAEERLYGWTNAGGAS